MQIYVGQVGIHGGVRRYASRFDMVEVIAEPQRLPRIGRLKEWRQQVPADFVFSVVVPAALAGLDPSAEQEAAWRYASKVFQALGAQWWVVRTPTTATPSAVTKKRLGALFEQLRSLGGQVAWEPRGVWEGAQAVATAESHGVRVVRDLSRDELVEGDVVYTRLRALGQGARVGVGAAERLTERLEGVTRAFVIVEGAGAGRVRQVLREELGLAKPAAIPSEEVE